MSFILGYLGIGLIWLLFAIVINKKFKLNLFGEYDPWSGWSRNGDGTMGALKSPHTGGRRSPTMSFEGQYGVLVPTQAINTAMARYSHFL
jgi:hypothetical protein